MKFKIEFHGVACFSIEVNEITLVFDPHDGKSLGLPEPTIRNADIVLVSHKHYDHDAGKDLVASKDASMLIEEEGEFNLKGLSGYSVRFTIDKKGNVTKLEFIQPNGIFTAEKKN